MAGEKENFLSRLCLALAIGGICSCSGLLTSSTSGGLECDEFSVGVEEIDLESGLFAKGLKDSLTAKFALVTNRSLPPSRSDHLCELQLRLDSRDFPSILADSGTPSRTSRNIIVSYRLKIGDRLVEKSLTMAHVANVSAFGYSEHIRGKKDSDAMAETLAENIFLDVLRQLK
jgi:hypothetical protein